MNLASLILTLLPATALTMPNITRPNPQLPLAPIPLPPPGPSHSGPQIIKALTSLSRTTTPRLTLIAKIPLEGPLWEPEGIVRLAPTPSTPEDERFWVSAGEYTTPTSKYPNGEWRDGTDRTPGAGFAHFVIFNGRGKRLGDWVVTQEGDIEYHNGGLDYDGTHIWATLSQYRPNSTATIIKIDPANLTLERMFAVGDHQGGIIHATTSHALTTLTWGGRKATRWTLSPSSPQQQQQQHPLTPSVSPAAETINPSHWIDYQDCKFLGYHDGRPVMLCSGIATLAPGVEVGGLAIVDVETMVPVWEVPFMERTKAQGVLVTKNPMDVAVVDGRVRLYFAPEEGESVLYVYELQ
ncbi:hypothetical protein CKAH01_17431 [Colletotrichum kahawae]|uniref:Secreted protein n=1 Tax=Colletotrichum kahawae TaxID=34407 RepID=A0AAD9Y9X8_COLKA|nr:hypothetical protein CKAH01_17431 [Colletotrichum kahawae]